MTSVFKEFEDQYNNLVRDYGGKWVLLGDNEVIFADSSFNTVYERYLIEKSQKDCEIIHIDDGEAAFYAFTVPVD